jgi:MoaA/NifB/PqqE/SkfB family radical SAM enzyme
MSQEVFDKAIELAAEREQIITLGGGEPTLHPLFESFLWKSIKALWLVTFEMGGPAVAVITNGSATKTAIDLAHLAQVGYIHAAVSKDDWHDEIDPRVFEAFRKPKRDYYSRDSNDNDCREIRSAVNIVPAGRAKANDLGTSNSDCVCEGIFVSPDGTVYPCGCKVNPLGNVFENFEWPEEETCGKRMEKRELVLT